MSRTKRPEMVSESDLRHLGPKQLSSKIELVGLAFALIVVVWVITYGLGRWYQYARAIPDMLPLIPPVLATFATIVASIVAAGSTYFVSLSNQQAQIDLAEKSAEYSAQLEEKKKNLSADLEREKMALDILKSDTKRRLDLIDHATASLSEYSIAMGKLRRGVFAQDMIEENEQAMRNISVQWDRQSQLFGYWQEFLRSGIYLKELAEQRTTADGWRKVWAAADGKRPGAEFGEAQVKVIEALSKERKNILQAR